MRLGLIHLKSMKPCSIAIRSIFLETNLIILPPTSCIYFPVLEYVDWRDDMSSLQESPHVGFVSVDLSFGVNSNEPHTSAFETTF